MFFHFLNSRMKIQTVIFIQFKKALIL